MDDLDDYGLTLTHREVELILDLFQQAIDEEDEDSAELAALMVKITTQTGVQ